MLVAVFALLSLLLSGGVYTHAYEIGPQSQVHSAYSADNHGHASKCPMCKEDERPIHCGANILIIAAVGDLAHPVGTPQTVAVRHSQLAGRMLVPEPPPPRCIPVFDI